MNDELNKILEILEKVRLTKYPTFPPLVLENVLKIQSENKSDPGVAQRKVTKYFTDYFNKEQC